MKSVTLGLASLHFPLTTLRETKYSLLVFALSTSLGVGKTLDWQGHHVHTVHAHKRKTSPWVGNQVRTHRKRKQQHKHSEGGRLIIRADEQTNKHLPLPLHLLTLSFISSHVLGEHRAGFCVPSHFDVRWSDVVKETESSLFDFFFSQPLKLNSDKRRIHWFHRCSLSAVVFACKWGLLREVTCSQPRAKDFLYLLEVWLIPLFPYKPAITLWGNGLILAACVALAETMWPSLKNKPGVYSH